jgi:hypothetical protein
MVRTFSAQKCLCGATNLRWSNSTETEADQGLHCENFAHQKQHLTVINTAKLSKNCEKPLNERPGRLTTGVRLLYY